MTTEELLRVEIALSKGIAESRQHAYDHLSKCYDLMTEIANFWREHAKDGTTISPELEAKIDAFRARG